LQSRLYVATWLRRSVASVHARVCGPALLPCLVPSYRLVCLLAALQHGHMHAVGMCAGSVDFSDLVAAKAAQQKRKAAERKEATKGKKSKETFKF